MGDEWQGILVLGQAWRRLRFWLTMSGFEKIWSCVIEWEPLDNLSNGIHQMLFVFRFSILSFMTWFEFLEFSFCVTSFHIYIVLQEVTPAIYDIFQITNWWKVYRCSVMKDSHSRGYFCMLVSFLLPPLLWSFFISYITKAYFGFWLVCRRVVFIMDIWMWLMTWCQIFSYMRQINATMSVHWHFSYHWESVFQYLEYIGICWSNLEFVPFFSDGLGNIVLRHGILIWVLFWSTKVWYVYGLTHALTNK